MKIRSPCDCPSGADNRFGPVVVGCRNDADFTLFFEQCILSLLPSAFLLLLVPIRFFSLHKSNVKTLPSYLQVAKVIFALVLTTLHLELLVLWSTNRMMGTQASIPSAALSFIAAVATLALSPLEQSRSVEPSSLLNVYLLFSLVLDLPQARTLHYMQSTNLVTLVFIASIAVKFILLLLEAQDKALYLKDPYQELSPETTGGVFSRTFFWWLNPLFMKGYHAILSPSDLFALDQGLASEPLGYRLAKAWDKRFKPEKRYTLVLVIFKAMKFELLGLVLPRLCLIAFTFAQPFWITRAIDFVSQPENKPSASDGYLLIVATFVIYLGIAISSALYKHRVNRMRVMLRGATIALIFNRTLLMQDGVYDESAAVTLMSTDTDHILASLNTFGECFANILEVIIGLYLLTRQLGWVSIIPLLVIGLCAIGSTQVSKRIGGKAKIWTEAVQQRLAKTSSMLGNMKSIKMMGLGDFMFELVQGQRIRELSYQNSFRWIVLWINVFANVSPLLVPVFTFAAFSIQAAIRGSSSLDTEKAFTSLAIISLVSIPAIGLLTVVPFTLASLGSFDRIQAYLLAPIRLDQRSIPGSTALEDSNQAAPEHNTASNKRNAIVIEEVDVKPAPTADLALHNINMRVQRGSFTFITGPVGCGKSTLLKAILGELPCDRGQVSIMSSQVSFCAQTSWLPNISIQDNVCGIADRAILDKEWYQRVLHTCALNEDIQQLPEGDQSLVGSRGVTLSGGQKQRLALARAIYTRREILVLDDVLSALDAKTEGLIVKRLIGENGLLRELGTTLVLVTHTTRHFPLSDDIVVLTPEGSVAQQGTFNKLKTEEGYVSTVLLHPQRKEDTEEQPAQEKQTIQAKENPLITQAQDLARKTGDLAIYGYYFRAVGIGKCLVFVSSRIVTVFFSIFLQIWLKWWTDENGSHIAKYISVYFALACGNLMFIAVHIWSLIIVMAPAAGLKLHYVLLRTVLGASQSFFSLTDVGTTLNRFSQDIELIDGNLPISLLQFMGAFFMVIGQIVLISTTSGYFVITTPFLGIVLFVLQNVYLRTSRQLRYMEIEAKAPVYSYFVETLDGISTIRAFGWQKLSSSINIKRVDASQKPYYQLLCIQRWLSLVLDLIVATIAVIVTTLAINLRSSVDPGLLGIALNNILSFSRILTLLIDAWTNLETSLGAVVRIKDFQAQTAPEAQPGEDIEPPANWPEKGSIEFQQVTASYGSAIALRNISMIIESGQKIGVCGRTGSGKSTLLSTLLRLVEMSSGTILIDGMDLRYLSRELIRQRLITIPQDPYILSGSVRLNLDPLGGSESDKSTLSDAALTKALETVRLWPAIATRGGLDADLDKQPLSHGQQQMLCLARALLQKGSILILDEATSNVDLETDKLMQGVIREAFQNHTVITVAHRLDTIMDSDRVAVLDKGELVEFEAPGVLLQREGSAFKDIHGG